VPAALRLHVLCEELEDFSVVADETSLIHCNFILEDNTLEGERTLDRICSA
jgi:hypothetical protein